MKTVLFLGSGNYYRSRFAEYFFNHHAKIDKLSWRADSRGSSSVVIKIPVPFRLMPLSDSKQGSRKQSEPGNWNSPFLVEGDGPAA